MENIMWAVGAILLLFCGVGIRILLLKDGKFRGSCSSQNITGDESAPFVGRQIQLVVKTMKIALLINL